MIENYTKYKVSNLDNRKCTDNYNSRLISLHAVTITLSIRMFTSHYQRLNKQVVAHSHTHYKRR